MQGLNTIESQQATQASSNPGTSSVTEQLSNTQENNSFVEQSTSHVSSINAINTATGGSYISRPKLPKLVLPKFKGEITSYRTFWDSFESAVHKNPELSKIDKLTT